MTCAGCGSELSAQFAFCPRCGRRQPVACHACGAACEADFAFCPHCGAAREVNPPAKGQGTAAEVPILALAPASTRGKPASTPQAAGEADRRQVTVLFA